MKNELYGKDILDLTELTTEQLKAIITLAIAMKKNPAHYADSLKGKILGMVFAKASTRTRLSFEAGILQLGGHAIVLNSQDSQIGRGEPIKDTANVMSGYLDGIMIRTYADADVAELAAHSTIPVINGLTDLHHPCQCLADLQTIYEWKGTFKGVTLMYIGDGNNVAHSLLIGGAKVGLNVAVVSPQGYEPAADIVAKAKELAEATGAVITVTDKPETVIGSTDFIYTDTWASMGQENEKAAKEAVFLPDYQVTAAMMAAAAPDCKFMHCLPAYRGSEVTAEVIDGPQSIIYQEAENRLHAQKALMLTLMSAEA
ncbi:ornithine carbamoyltransferase [Vagococcus acidifermentans]|uniref:Ornithine carbamoyltransferase n=1 Tax=Vagococcus acidifermentans TaxID=564710 RepID=A0A430AXX8_9ENTE|nr:ornithine carbamoyltransferase [Vagococcus acidifermentans]RSU12922.1 ornithine carbamoyltransferase [Vagococcus acidifermentans]